MDPQVPSRGVAAAPSIPIAPARPAAATTEAHHRAAPAVAIHLREVLHHPLAPRRVTVDPHPPATAPLLRRVLPVRQVTPLQTLVPLLRRRVPHHPPILRVPVAPAPVAPPLTAVLYRNLTAGSRIRRWITRNPK